MSVSIQFPAADVRALTAQMDRAQRELGKSVLSSVQWASRLLLSSCAASTKVSAKLRPIVKNPDSRWKTDKRRAPFGVYKYKDGQKVFAPIYKTGEFGKNRFFDKKSMSFFDRSSGSGQWRRITSGPYVANPEIVVPGIKTDKRRKIGRSGFAKKTWKWAQAHVGSGGNAVLMGVPNIASVVVNKSKTDPSVKITNRINYIEHAMKGGWQAINTAMGRAARNMENKIADQIAKKLGAT